MRDHPADSTDPIPPPACVRPPDQLPGQITTVQGWNRGIFRDMYGDAIMAVGFQKSVIALSRVFTPIVPESCGARI